MNKDDLPDYEMLDSYEYIGPWEKWVDYNGCLHLVDKEFWLGKQVIYCFNCNTAFAIKDWIWVDDVGDYCPEVSAFLLNDDSSRMAGKSYGHDHRN